MTHSPYEELPPERFWRTGVAQHTPETIKGLYRRRFAISKRDAIGTAGSCFAQHIANHLRQHGANLLDAEPPPPGLSDETMRRFGFGMFSARYGNIYTARQLLQLLLEAFGHREPGDIVWTRSGRHYDALRPGIEPEGHARTEDVMEHRAEHLAKVRQLFETMDVFIFTFGLTEAWQHRTSGTVYPTAPGTIAGTFAAEVYEFHNFGFSDTIEDFRTVRRFLKDINPDMRFLVTVSPVPLTATASSEHVLAATTYSKSVLRAVCGQLYQECPDLDYFPSYELIATPFSRASFFEPNLRSVTAAGVQRVMEVFFSEHVELAGARREKIGTPSANEITGGRLRPRRARRLAESRHEADVVCEEVMLDAFGR